MEVPNLSISAKTRESYIKKNYVEFYNYLMKYPTELTWKERIYWYRNGLNKIPVCKTCGKKLKFSNMQDGYRKFCSSKCAASNPETIQKHISTCIEKYGVDNISKIDSVKTAKTKSMQEHFGDNYKDIIHQKVKQTTFKRYGGYTLSSPELRGKVKQTMIQRYGVSNPMKNSAIREKIAKTNFERYGVKNASSSPAVKEKVKQTMIQRYGENYMDVINTVKSTSRMEENIISFIESLGIECMKGSYSIIPPLQLDVYLPAYSIAFEVNGSYWHSLKQKDPQYHTNKSIMCAEKNIRCIHLWEDWDIEVIKSFIVDILTESKLSKYKKLWFPDLRKNEWPCDFGIKEGKRWKEHKCQHGGYECIDSGVVVCS